jgi:thiamine kinase-like enzyme
LLKDVAEARLTPPVVSTATGDVLVTSYLGLASVWSDANAREPENIARIAQRLRELHALSHDLPQFNAVSVADSYCRRAATGRVLTSEQREWQRKYLDLASAYDETSSPEALCHQDLVASNILDDGELWFIDFEYAVRADPILDLASLASMNSFNAVDRSHLLLAYYGEGVPVILEKRLDDATSMLQLQSYFWALAKCSNEGPEPAVQQFVDDMTAVLR